MSDAPGLRVAALNLQQGGQRRAGAIAKALEQHHPDVVVLGEAFPDGRAADTVRHVLPGIGLVELAGVASDTPGIASGVLIAAREPFERLGQPISGGPNRQRVLEVRVRGVRIVGTYFPLNRAKVAFWREEFLPLVGSRRDEQALLVGDWNSGSHYLDETGATLYAAEEFESLAASGWTDAWRARHGNEREYTWYSPQPYRNGFRLDHAFLSPSLAPRLRDARYDHSTREAKVSDHSMLIVDLEPA